MYYYINKFNLFQSANISSLLTFILTLGRFTAKALCSKPKISLKI